MNKHPWPTSLVATLILCAAVTGLCAQENANAPRYAPGLLQCFSAGDQAKESDCRISRLVALYNPAGATLSPFLEPGRVEVQ